MSANVEPEEAEAIHDLARDETGAPAGAKVAAEVVQRDFRRPRRFSGDSIARFRQRLLALAAELEAGLGGLFETRVRVEFDDVGEVTANGLFDTLDPPHALAELSVGGQPGWIQWDILGAVEAIERLLGSEGAPEARPLSTIENRFLHAAFSATVDVVTRALGLEASDLTVVKAREELSDWRDGGEGAESHRLHVAVAVEGLGETSRMHLYLPGVRESGAADDGAALGELPEHLQRVKIELGAHLGASDVPLSDLLSLEIGDVIPLGTSLSDPLVLRVEGRPCGFAEMGSVRGNRAIRVLAVDPPLDDLV